MRVRTQLRTAAVSAVLMVGTAASVGMASSPTPYQRPGHTERVSLASNGAQTTYAPASGVAQGCRAQGGMDVSASGRYVAFATDANNLVPEDTNHACDVFRRDRVTGRTTRVSVASDGSQALAGPPNLIGSREPSISADGRYVAFQSDALNLVPGDTNVAEDVFVHDVQTGRTTRVSVTSAGAQDSNESVAVDMHPSISADGRYIAFASYSPTLVSGDTNGTGDVFVHDMKTGTTVRSSVSSSGAQGNNGSGGYGISISGNGRYVAFASSAANLVPGDTLGEACGCTADDIFRHDLKTGKTIRVSVASDGAQASFAGIPSCAGGLFCHTEMQGSTHNLSFDGRFITFASTATNLVPNDTNYGYPSTGIDVFVHDVTTGRTERVSVDSSGHQRDGASLYTAFNSNDARLVSYGYSPSSTTCYAMKILGQPVELPLVSCGAVTSIQVYDRASGSMEEASVAVSGGTPAAGGCAPTDGVLGTKSGKAFPGGMGRDGRYVGFMSSAPNLVAGDTDNTCDYFVRDRGTSLGVGLVLDSGSDTSAATDQHAAVGRVYVQPRPSTPGITAQASLARARIVARPSLRDLWFRWDLERLGPVNGAPAGGVMYAMSFSAGGNRYQVRAQRVPGPDYDVTGGASFALFRETAPGVFTRVASLEGGFGTTGESVVTAVPLSLLGGQAQLTNVTAYTAVGSYLSGPTKVLDSLRLSR